MRSLYVILLTLLTSNAFAGPCVKGTALADVLRANSGNSYIFYIYHSPQDVSFMIPGKDLTFPWGMAENIRFRLDGVNTQVNFAEISQFSNGRKFSSEIESLREHQKWEVEYIVASGTKWNKTSDGVDFYVSGNGNQPAHSFLYWYMTNPALTNGPSQQYVSTVVGDYVFVMGFQSETSDALAATVEKIREVAKSFRFVLSVDQCPKK